MRLTQTIDGIKRYVDVPEGADSTVAVLKESGWEEVPELTQANPALAPGEPETPAEPAKSTRKSSSKSTDE
jgi:hypothetical protein